MQDVQIYGIRARGGGDRVRLALDKIRLALDQLRVVVDKRADLGAIAKAHAARLTQRAPRLQQLIGKPSDADAAAGVVGSADGAKRRA